MSETMPRRSGAGSPVTPMARGVQAALTFLTVFSFIVGGFALAPQLASADAGVEESVSSTTQTTDDLNLRAEPSLNAEILDVIPAGVDVTVDGPAENGFYAVTWDGQSGYAYGDYLTGYSAGDGPVSTDGEQGEVYVADGPVNFRTGPSTDDSVIMVIPDGALVALNGDSANGFLGVIYNDQSGWAHEASVLGTGEDPVAEEPTGEEPVTEVPGTEPPASEEEEAGNTPTEAPATEEPVNEEPVTEEPATEEPVTEEPVTEEPATEEPTVGPTEAPATEVPATEPPDGSDGYTEEEIIAIIYAAADEYEQPREDMLRVARCESVLDPNAVNSSSGASGLFQFMPSTWESTPYADQDIFDPVANANAAAWMWANGRRNEWTCQ